MHLTASPDGIDHQQRRLAARLRRARQVAFDMILVLVDGDLVIELLDARVMTDGPRA